MSRPKPINLDEQEGPQPRHNMWNGSKPSVFVDLYIYIYIYIYIHTIINPMNAAVTGYPPASSYTINRSQPTYAFIHHVTGDIWKHQQGFELLIRSCTESLLLQVQFRGQRRLQGDPQAPLVVDFRQVHVSSNRHLGKGPPFSDKPNGNTSSIYAISIIGRYSQAANHLPQADRLRWEL